MIKKISLLALILLIASAILYYFWKPTGVVQPKINPVDFSHLPGWDDANLKPSFKVFKASCKVFLKTEANKEVGNELIAIKAVDWFPTCKEAMKLDDSVTTAEIKAFFQTWFTPVEFNNGQIMQGLFTGYYVPSLKGSLKKTDQYQVPIYGMPDDLITVKLNEFDPLFKHRTLVGRVVRKHRLIPYYTRAEIDRGAIADQAPVIAWVDSKIDRLFLEIQGSGVIELTDGSLMYVGYAAQNGAPYTAIAAVLIKKGVMTRDNASMQHIRRYLQAHPKEITPILNQNKSFVFFETSTKPDAYGSQGIALTPGYSMAVDIDWVPLGTPLWLNTSRPDIKTDKAHPFKRLMVAQDTGGAIKGTVRGDVFWGAGKRATKIAGRMKHPGHYWMLLPKHLLERSSA